ncbi:MAG: family 10 glycosylhydrolase [Clostridia bacterium]|nr:family 10 glycosylhydrolase [Clostridia bacterium]
MKHTSSRPFLLIALSMLLISLLLLVACDKKTPPAATEAPTEAPTETQTQEVQAMVTEAPTEAPTEEATMKTYTVKFVVSNTANQPEDQIVIEGELAVDPVSKGQVAIPENGSYLDGWYTSEDLNEENLFDFSTPITSDLTLYAVIVPPQSITYDWKAMWLSQFDLQGVYTNGGKQRDEADYTKRIGEILDNVVELGFNTVIVQMRPYADSMYPSEVYPPSRYTTGSYANDFTYDPMAILIDAAHERGLDVHAWINPIRGMLITELNQVSAGYKIKDWYTDSSTKGKYVTVVKDRAYLNPAYEEVRQLIIDGAKEILEKYDVEGVHMDDYFYPTTDASFDASAYNAYKKDGGKLELGDWRRENLNKLIAGLYEATKAHDKKALFGISPAGNINTVYEAHYADIYKWCSEDGYVDYMMPQVYFGFEHSSWAFDKTCKIWQDIIKNDKVTLIIGMSFGKALAKVDNYAGAGKNEWAQHTDIMKRSVEYTGTLDKCVGISVFCYQYFYDPVSGKEIAGTVEEVANFVPVFKDITWHPETAE